MSNLHEKTRTRIVYVDSKTVNRNTILLPNRSWDGLIIYLREVGPWKSTSGTQNLQGFVLMQSLPLELVLRMVQTMIS